MYSILAMYLTVQIGFNSLPTSGMNAAVHGAAVTVYIIMIVVIFLLIYIVCQRRSLRSKTHMERGTHKSTKTTSYYINYG